MIHEPTHCLDRAVSHQLPIAVAFWIIQIVSTEECLSLMQNLMQIHCSPCSVILNVMATQYTCSLNGIYCAHWLVQWRLHCSDTHIPVHYPWLSGYVDVAKTLIMFRLDFFRTGLVFSERSIYSGNERPRFYVLFSIKDFFHTSMLDFLKDFLMLYSLTL